MASFPSAASQLRPVAEQESPIDQYGRILQLKNMMAQGQMQQQQLQGTKLENQQRQMDLDSQMALQKAYMDANGDMDKTAALAAKSGKVKPGALLEWQKTATQQKLATLDLVSKQGDLAKIQADLMQGAHDAVANAPAEDRPAVYQQQLQQLQQRGVDISQVPQQYPGDEQFKYVGVALKSHTQMVEDALKAAGIRKETADAIKTENLNQIGGDKQFREAKYHRILNDKVSGKALSKDESDYLKSYEASESKTTTQSDSLGVKSVSTNRPSGSAMVGAGSGSGNGMNSNQVKDSLVDLIGQYRYNPANLQRLMMSHPEIIAYVGQKYPNWDQTNYQAKAKLMTGYTSGPQSKEINAINTALGHVGVLGDAIDALKNNDIKALNRIANFFGVQTGATPVTTFNTIIHRVGPELTTAYVQGGGTGNERGTTEADFDPALGPDQLKANIGITARLLRSKIGSLEQQYNNLADGLPPFEQRFLTPEAKKSLNKYSPQASLSQASAPQTQKQLAGTKANMPEGSTGKGSDGKAYIVKGGVWVPQQ